MIGRCERPCCARETLQPDCGPHRSLHTATASLLLPSRQELLSGTMQGASRLLAELAPLCGSLGRSLG